MSLFKNLKNKVSEIQNVISEEIDNTIDDLHDDAIEMTLEESGIETDVFETFLSRPADKINLPEIVRAKSTFIYNYYTQDERVREGTTDAKEKILSLDASLTEEIFFQSKNKKLPRYVKITIKPPKINDNLINTTPLNQLGIDLEESLNLIVTEGASSSQIFTGVELIDTGRESKLYSMLKGTMVFSELNVEKSSQKEAAVKLHSTLKEKGGLHGQDKKLITEALSNIASEGYNLAPSDVPADIAAFASDPVGKQSFSVQFNNLLMADIIANSTIVPDNTFQDEVRGLSSFSRDVKREVLGSIPPPNTFREADYDLQVKAVQQKEIVGSTNYINQIKAQYPKIRFTGYLIEKYEILPDESVEFLGRMFVQGHNSTFAIDNRVRYGAAYFYKIRTVCLVEAIASSENRTDSSLNQNVLAKMLMASEGVMTSVSCVEKIPPPAPVSMRATFDFESLKPRISWQFPLNKQRDIKRFQIFKRFSIETPFILLKEYDFDNSLIRGAVPEIAPKENIVKLPRPVLSFVDISHVEGEKPIYSIACVDAHGMSSNYGPQVRVERDRYTNIVTRTIISGPNAPKPYPNLFINVDAFQDCIKVSGYDRIKVILDPEYYKLTRTKENINLTSATANDFQINTVEQTTNEIDLGLLAIDPNNFRYKLHFMNIDNQKDAIVKIKLQNFASPGSGDENAFEVSAAKFSEKNINFQYGIE
tara:strand:- start:1407 stop:3521 length:2115 start_codon:yes stop_codon:yes gene_type:complete